MSTPSLPPCGLYRTTATIGDVPAGRLVYFHNHGDPGPGVYLPEGWHQNRARFAERGHTLPRPVAEHADSLKPLRPEGMYRVARRFHCCDQRCHEFEEELLVQLGYDGHGRAIVFVPEWNAEGFTLPTTGTGVDDGQLTNLEPLKVAHRRQTATRRDAAHLH